MADQPDFPNIYIDKGCAGTHVGSEANPYDALADINWTTGGDNSIYDYLNNSPAASPTIHLNKGDTWREQMTVDCDGTATYPIIITSYGSGDNPLINGADIITGWSSSAGASASTWTQVAQTGDDTCDDYHSDHYINYRNIIEAGIASTSGTQIRIKLKAHSASTMYVDGTSIGLRSGSTEDFSAAPTRITWDTDNNTTTITAGATKWSDWMDFSFDEAVDHLVHIYATDAHEMYGVRWIEGSGTNSYYWNSGNDDTLLEDATADGSGMAILSLEEIEVQTPSDAYEATVNTEPERVYYDGTELTENDGATIDVGSSEWDWDSNTLYVNVGEDPDTGTLEAAQRQYCIYTAKDYTVVDGVDLTKSNYYNLRFSAACTNGTAQNLTTTYGAKSGLLFYEMSGTILVDNCTVTHSGEHGIWAYTVTAGTIKNSEISYSSEHSDVHHNISYEKSSGLTIENNTIHHNDGQAQLGGDTNSNCIIQDNVIHTSTQAGIDFSSPGACGSNIVRRNIIYGHTTAAWSGAVHIWANGGGNTSNDNQVYYNIIYGNNVGIYVGGDCDNNKIYNNVLYNNGKGICVVESNSIDPTDTLLKNNIIYSSSDTHLYFDQTEATNLSDYNCLYPDDTNCFYWDSTYYHTLADWRTQSSQDANSINSDPLFIDAANDNFYLQSTSPCIDTGTDVSLTEDYVGHPIIGDPDMGAYEFQTISIGAGSYTITGQTMSPLHDKILSIGTGSYALTGKTLSPLHNKKLGINAGNYTLTGKAVSPLHAKILNIGAGSYTLTGKTMSPVHDKILSIGTGNYAVTGEAVTFAKTEMEQLGGVGGLGLQLTLKL